MPIWPSDLPCAPISGTLRTRPEPNIAEFRPDVGRPQRALRSTRARRMYSGTLKCTTAQKDQLLDFYEIDCAFGVNAFQMTDWARASGAPAVTKTFTFDDVPDPEQRGPNVWFVALDLSRED